MLGSRTETVVGRPIVPDAAVHAVVEEHVRNNSITSFFFFFLVSLDGYFFHGGESLQLILIFSLLLCHMIHLCETCSILLILSYHHISLLLAFFCLQAKSAC